ncbi:hypothetical protein MTP99_003004 [Tenebrio molitor]|nr:hypothetical protein MTP99_003004 [Tenebrio molitor]
MADFMGHTFDLHSNHYRMPEQTTQIINISRFLSVVGDKDVYKHKGKSWQELQLLLPSDNQEEDEEHQPVCPSIDHTLDAQDGSMTFHRSRFAAADSPPPFRRQPFRRWASSPRPFRRGCSAPVLFLATCYSYFSINLTKRKIFSVSCQ